MWPAIEELNRTLNETIQVWVLKGARVSYIDGLESTQPLSVRTGVWDLVPAYCSAGGKVLLAELGNNELESIHADGLIPWRSSNITTLQLLKRRLVTVRQDGYAVSLEEAAQGIAGIAACVKDALGHPVAAISVAIPRSRLNRKQIPAYAKALQAAVDIVEMKITKPGEMFSDAT
jgi:IclR family acetate operon transcriptional repressor